SAARAAPSVRPTRRPLRIWAVRRRFRTTESRSKRSERNLKYHLRLCGASAKSVERPAASLDGQLRLNCVYTLRVGRYAASLPDYGWRLSKRAHCEASYPAQDRQRNLP